MGLDARWAAPHPPPSPHQRQPRRAGTTTATVLARAILNEGCKSVAAGMNPMDLRRGINLAVDHVVGVSGPRPSSSGAVNQYLFVGGAFSKGASSMWLGVSEPSEPQAGRVIDQWSGVSEPFSPPGGDLDPGRPPAARRAIFWVPTWPPCPLPGGGRPLQQRGAGRGQAATAAAVPSSRPPPWRSLPRCGAPPPPAAGTAGTF